MKVSIVLTTYNRRNSLELCLRGLANQRFPAEEYEVVVVADGCTDGTVELLRSFCFPCGFRWFEKKNQGQPAAQNFGVAVAKGDIVLFMDDDIICDAELVAAHYSAQMQGDHRVVIGVVTVHPDSPRGTLSEMTRKWQASESRRLSYEGARRLDLMLCANSSIDRKAAIECPFDTTYKRFHDVEAGVRLWAKGYRPYFEPKAVAYELYTKSAKALLIDSWQQGKHEVLLSRSYPSFKSLSGLGSMLSGNLLKRVLRKKFALHPLGSEILLSSIYFLAESLRFFPPFQWIAKRVLSARAVVAYLRGAINEAGSWEMLVDLFGKRVPVIMYHNVGAPRVGEYPGLTTPTAEFESQIRLLSALGYRGVQPSDWLEWCTAGGTLPKRPVMLVFDDAYAEACRNAFPILERYGFGAACMVVTQCIGSTNRWDEEAGRPSFPIMSKSEIVAWSRKNIEFGGHTGSHPNLAEATEDRIEREIAECKNDLTALLDNIPASFAYPFGAVSPKARAVAQKHFQLAFTTSPGQLSLETNPHLIPRINFLPGESRIGIWCRLRFGKNPFEICRTRWSRFLRRASRRD